MVLLEFVKKDPMDGTMFHHCRFLRTFKIFQAYVKINFSENGYADIYLKDIAGAQLFHKKITGNFW